MLQTTFLGCAALALLSTGAVAAPTDRAGRSSIEASTAARGVDSTNPGSAEPTRYRYSNKVLLFRHGEKRSDTSIGLSEKGKKRAQCLRRVRPLFLCFSPPSPLTLAHVQPDRELTTPNPPETRRTETRQEEPT